MSTRNSIKTSRKILYVLLPLVFITSFSNPSRAECTSNGEPECSGYWNIYASIPNGDRWELDHIGSDPVAIKADRQAKAIQARLEACGINSELSNSSWFSAFTRNLLIVHSQAFGQSNLAKSELQRAKVCGLTGYTKLGVMSPPGPGED